MTPTTTPLLRSTGRWTRIGGLLTLLGALACGIPEEPTPVSSPTPVAVETLARGPFRPSIELLGLVAPADRVPIQALEAGRVRYAERFRSGLRLGAAVRAGEALFVLENDDLRHAKETAEIELRAAETEVEQARRGVDAGFLPPIDLEKAEVQHDLAVNRLAREASREERLTVAAPAGGYLVVDDVVAEGTEVRAGAVLAHVSGEGLPRIEGFLSPSDLARVSVGLEVECRRAGGDDVVGRARISELARESGSRGAVRLLARVVSDDDLPPIGEGVDLRILLPEVRDTLTVPQSALLVEGGLSVVYTLEPHEGNLRAARTLVSQGSSSDARVQILGGLSEGDVIAVRGVDLLADGVLARDVGER